MHKMWCLRLPDVWLAQQCCGGSCSRPGDQSASRERRTQQVGLQKATNASLEERAFDIFIRYLQTLPLDGVSRHTRSSKCYEKVWVTFLRHSLQTFSSSGLTASARAPSQFDCPPQEGFRALIQCCRWFGGIIYTV
jgi:hypothetical protein